MQPSIKIFQVLESLKRHATDAVPKAFAIQEQYIPAVLAKRAKQGGGKPCDDDDDEDEKQVKNEKPSKPPKGEKGENVKPPQGEKAMEPKGWPYSDLRNKFMQIKICEGFTWNESKNLWDESLDKANFLSEVSVQELKRRKFLPKGSQVNPWHEKIHGKGK